ncbi:MAG: HAD-IA family hydrolase [Bacteriovoracaceae bacterium]|nr:HAD-IA family hydrolase [Bacteriovoracaceae bacterium]
MIEPDKAIGHIVFDCDGTLISSHQAILMGLQKLMGGELNRKVSIEEIEEKLDMRMDVIANNFRLDISTPESQKRLLDKWALISQKTEYQYALFDGIKDLLQELSKKGYCLYVWTGRDRVSTLDILNDLKAISWFYDFRTASDGIPKPHPQGMEELVGSFDKNKVVLIGDSVADQLGASQYGCHFLAASWCPNAKFENLLHDDLIKRPLDCVVHIERLLSN